MMPHDVRQAFYFYQEVRLDRGQGTLQHTPAACIRDYFGKLQITVIYCFFHYI